MWLERCRVPDPVSAPALMGGNDARFDAARQKDMNHSINRAIQAISH